MNCQPSSVAKLKFFQSRQSPDIQAAIQYTDVKVIGTGGSLDRTWQMTTPDTPGSVFMNTRPRSYMGTWRRQKDAVFHPQKLTAACVSGTIESIPDYFPQPPDGGTQTPLPEVNIASALTPRPAVEQRSTAKPVGSTFSDKAQMVAGKSIRRNLRYQRW